MFITLATVKYYDDYCIALVQQDIVDYSLRLLPKCLYIQRQKYDAHITISRKYKEQPSFENWGYKNNHTIVVQVDTVINTDGIYYWLNCYSSEIIEIRNKLGLSDYRTGFNSFHLTIGNTKGN